jgi:hypothetical protein
MSTSLIPATIVAGNSVSASEVAYIYESLTSTNFVMNMQNLQTDTISISAQSSSAMIYAASLNLSTD